jgi:flagellar motor protein MotB
MRGMAWKLLVVVGCTVFLAGCFESDPMVKDLQTKNSQLQAEVTDLSGQKTRLEQDLAKSRQDKEVADLETERWKNQCNETAKIIPTNPGVSPEVMAKFVSIARTGSTWTLQDGRLRASSDILFESGKADLKPQAKVAITEVAPKLKDLLGDKSVVLGVYGFTDADPIKRSGWKDNLHLSMMRARAVVEALKEQGVPAESMFAAGFGEYRPIPGAPKDKNRRVEMVIVPAGQ